MRKTPALFFLLFGIAVLLCVSTNAQDTCTFSVFQKLIGGPGNDEGYDIKKTNDGGYLIAGKTGPAGGLSDALMMKLDARGNAVWTKTYGSPGNDGFNRVIKTSDGNYAAIGWSKFNAGHVADVFIVKIDDNGNLIWSKSYGAGTANGEYGFDITQSDDGGYLLSVNYNTLDVVVQPLFMKLDANGSLVWSRLLGMNNAGQAAGAVGIGDAVIVTGMVSRQAGSTFNDGYIAKLRMSDGVLLWTRKIESENRSNRLEHLRFRNNELSFSMYNADSWTTGNVTPIILKADTSGNITYSQAYVIAGLNNNAVYPSIALTRDRGFIANISEIRSNTAPMLVKVHENGGVDWVRRYTPFISQCLFNTIDDTTGYVTIGRAIKQAGGTQDILLIKTDGMGKLAGSVSCPVENLQANQPVINVQSVPVDASWWSNISSGNVQDVPTNVVVNDISLPVQTSCVDSLPCNPGPVDTCGNFTFIKRYATVDSAEVCTGIIATADGHLLVPGQFTTPDAAQIDPALIKFRKDGSIAWQLKFYETGNQGFLQAINTSDNNYAVLASHILYKISAAGNVIWKRDFVTGTQGYGAVRLTEGSDGNFYIVGSRQIGFEGYFYVTKISASGAIVWSKSYLSPNTLVYLIPYDIADAGGSVMVTGQYFVTDATQYRWGFVTKINYTDGSVVFSNNYHINNQRVVFTQIQQSGSTFTINGVSPDKGNTGYLFRINGGGNLLKARELSSIGLNGDNQFITSSGDIIRTSRYQNNWLSMYKLDTSWETLWAKKYPQLPGTTYARGLVMSGGNLFISGNTFDISDASIGLVMFSRFTQDGELVSCPADTFTITHTDHPVIVAPFTFRDIQDVQFNNTVTSASLIDGGMRLVETACSGAAGKCDSVKISGIDSVCNFADTIQFSVYRNPGCKTSVQWRTDSAFVTLISKTDTSISIKFKKAGTVRLYADILTPCRVITDSMDIAVLTSRDTLELGPNRQLCKAATITLNAGIGFKSYKWQDGSADSIFTVSQPGTYFVEAQNYCGGILRDTVVVSFAPDVAFDLGPDLSKCNNDTLTITAPAGFTKYNWSANYNINNLQGQIVKVWPLIDTAYSAIAETTLGCLVYDTIRVKVNTSPPIDLGKDTSICVNDSLIIIAPPGFVSYNWSTGETSQQIIVKNKGIYKVQATAANNCVSKDSLEIRNVYTLPVVELGLDTFLCANGSLVYNAGNFPKYLWQDGSTNQFFTATQIGKIWVQVTSANGCINSDTTNILSIAAIPKDFIDTAAEFCPYEKTVLAPKGSFSKYKWSTGSTARTIEVNAPSIYWLEVTTSQGCTNREYINVKFKNCRNSISFPNAFTPNNDRKNETYKPVVKGVIQKYKFTIYNRWGQRVFETTQPTAAWDGTIGGRPQDSGSFVWICQYQFAGEEAKTARGILILVR